VPTRTLKISACCCLALPERGRHGADVPDGLLRLTEIRVDQPVAPDAGGGRECPGARVLSLPGLVSQAARREFPPRCGLVPCGAYAQLPRNTCLATVIAAMALGQPA
jgi:hypothetical protein